MKDYFTLRRHNQRGYGVYTKKSWEKGEKIINYEGRVLPTYLASACSLTLTAHFSFEWNKGSYFDYINHSCQPNCYMDLSTGVPVLRAIRDISSDEELCYNYNTIEANLTKEWFLCHCGNKNCIEWVRGFSYLTPTQEKNILDICSPFIKETSLMGKKKQQPYIAFDEGSNE